MEYIDGLSPEDYEKMCQYTKEIEEMNNTISALKTQGVDPVKTDSNLTFEIDGRKHKINNIYSIEMLGRQVRLLSGLIADLKIKKTT